MTPFRSLFFLPLILSLMSFSFSVYAEEIIRVGLEEAPPLIVKDGSGILNKVLREVEKKIPYRFTIEYMTYGRALVELKNKRIDLIGITPTENETEEFYTYAQDLNWSFQTYNVAFFRDEDSTKNSLNDFRTIGTPQGNEDFMAEMHRLPKAKYHGGPLASLFKMLKKRRLDVVVFESISSITTLESLGFKNISYKKMDKMKGGFSIRKEKTELKRILDKAFLQIEQEKIFAPVSRYQKLEGVRSLKVRD